MKELARAYWITGDDLQIIFGCYRTTSIEEFKNKAIQQNGKEKAEPFIRYADMVANLLKGEI